MSVDGGMSDNARPALYGAQYSAPASPRARATPRRCWRASSASTASRATSSSTPSTCPGDIAPGDLLAVPATGAYCFSLASNYNYVPRPPVVAVRGGEARVIVRGETVDDLLARDAGLRHPHRRDRHACTERAERVEVTDYRRLRVALLGAGAVGSQVASLLRKHGDELADRAGATLELVGIAVRDLDAPRDDRAAARAASRPMPRRSSSAPTS